MYKIFLIFHCHCFLKLKVLTFKNVLGHLLLSPSKISRDRLQPVRVTKRLPKPHQQTRRLTQTQRVTHSTVPRSQPQTRRATPH